MRYGSCDLRLTQSKRISNKRRKFYASRFIEKQKNQDAIYNPVKV